jgi:hypothetical protein
MVLDFLGRIWCWLAVLTLVAVLSWPEPKAARCRNAGDSINKACVGFLAWKGRATLWTSSSRSGGVGEKWWRGVLVFRVRRSWSCDTASWCTISAGFASWPTQMAIGWLRILPVVIPGASSTFKRRPCLELVVALHVDSTPSGSVPGADEDGHDLSSVFVCCGGGPDCFFLDLCRVLFIKARGLVVFALFLLVPFESCTRSFY